MGMSSQLFYKQKTSQDDAMNSIKTGLMSYVMHAGAEIVSVGELNGLFSKTTTYFLSDGSSFSFVSRNKFVPIDRIIAWD
jgi:hypothetical protein